MRITLLPPLRLKCLQRSVLLPFSILVLQYVHRESLRKPYLAPAYEPQPLPFPATMACGVAARVSPRKRGRDTGENVFSIICVGEGGREERGDRREEGRQKREETGWNAEEEI